MQISSIYNYSGTFNLRFSFTSYQPGRKTVVYFSKEAHPERDALFFTQVFLIILNIIMLCYVFNRFQN